MHRIRGIRPWSYIYHLLLLPPLLLSTFFCCCCWTGRCWRLINYPLKFSSLLIFLSLALQHFSLLCHTHNFFDLWRERRSSTFSLSLPPSLPPSLSLLYNSESENFFLGFKWDKCRRSLLDSSSIVQPIKVDEICTWCAHARMLGRHYL